MIEIHNKPYRLDQLDDELVAGGVAEASGGLGADDKHIWPYKNSLPSTFANKGKAQSIFEQHSPVYERNTVVDRLDDIIANGNNYNLSQVDQAVVDLAKIVKELVAPANASTQGYALPNS